MSDTNTTASSTASPVVQKRPRIKDSVALGICRGTDSAVKIVDSVAETIGAVAVRVKLHNVATAADAIDEYGIDKIKQAQQLIQGL